MPAMKRISIESAPVVAAVCNLLEADPDAELRIRTPRAGGIALEYRRRGRHVRTTVRGADLAGHPGGPDGAIAHALEMVRTSGEGAAGTYDDPDDMAEAAAEDARWLRGE